MFPWDRRSSAGRVYSKILNTAIFGFNYLLFTLSLISTLFCQERRKIYEYIFKFKLAWSKFSFWSLWHILNDSSPLLNFHVRLGKHRFASLPVNLTLSKITNNLECCDQCFHGGTREVEWALPRLLYIETFYFRLHVHILIIPAKQRQRLASFFVSLICLRDTAQIMTGNVKYDKRIVVFFD